MPIIKNYRHIFLALTLILFTTNIAKSTEECFEGTSRAIFKFNMAIDDIVFEPLAKGYNKLPSPIKAGTSNFTSNIGTLLSIPNNVFQGNFKQLGHSIGSFALNSTVGVFGILNPAEKIGLKPNKEDVGQTLGSYGIGPGCYFVLPVLGSTTVRDTFGMLADTFVDPFAHVTIREKELLSSSGNSLDFYSVKATTAIDFRADNDKNFESLEKNSIDLYSSIKSIYLQEEDDWGNLNN